MGIFRLMASSSWDTPTTDDVMGEFTPSEVASINTLMGGDTDVTAKLGAILGRTVAEIRGYIASGDYALDPISETIPPSLFVDAIALARWRFLIAAPQLKQLQTEERRDAMLRSITKLQAVSQSKFAIEPPVPPTTPSTGTWNSENKLLMRTHPVPVPPTSKTGDYANPLASGDP